MKEPEPAYEREGNRKKGGVACSITRDQSWPPWLFHLTLTNTTRHHLLTIDAPCRKQHSLRFAARESQRISNSHGQAEAPMINAVSSDDARVSP
jgi:hypothetical protein